METVSERRRRKLTALANARGGVARIAEAAGLSAAALDQVLKGTLLPPKADGTRNSKSLGDPSARAIEAALGLGHGWFDADDAAINLDPVVQLDELESALKTIADFLSKTDKVTRSAIAASFSLLAAEPHEIESVVATVKKLLPPRSLARTSQDDRSAGLVFKDLGSGDLNPDGKSTTVQGPRRRAK